MRLQLEWERELREAETRAPGAMPREKPQQR